MPYEFDRSRIEQIIRQAKQERAKYMREICGPAFKTIGSWVAPVFRPLMKSSDDIGAPAPLKQSRGQ